MKRQQRQARMTSVKDDVAESLHSRLLDIVEELDKLPQEDNTLHESERSALKEEQTGIISLLDELSSSDSLEVVSDNPKKRKVELHENIPVIVIDDDIVEEERLARLERLEREAQVRADEEFARHLAESTFVDLVDEIGDQHWGKADETEHPLRVKMKEQAQTLQAVKVLEESLSHKGRTLPFESKRESAPVQSVPSSSSGTVAAARSAMEKRLSAAYGPLGYDASDLNMLFGLPNHGGMDMDSYHGGSYERYNQMNTEELHALLENIRPDEEYMAANMDNMHMDGFHPRMRLMKHQQTGIAWMKDMENGNSKGGILADDMGLGKTIQAIGLVLSNAAERGQVKTTVVIAPVALLQQWENEILSKTSPKLRVYIHHGAHKVHTKYTDLYQYDIVLTTYGCIASELREDLLRVEKKLPQNPTRLFLDRAFHRVVLDEAQYIKNRKTKAAMGCCRILASYRWCLTGTPMQNNVYELQSLIKFLRIKPYDDHRAFSSKFGELRKSRNEGVMNQFRALLRALLLRRTKESKIEGEKILKNLPGRTTELSNTPFTQDQEEFYKGVETQAQIKIRKYMMAGTLNSHYSNILVMLLRLRQAACHMSLIKDVEWTRMRVEDGEGNMEVSENQEVELAKSLPNDVVIRLLETTDFECPCCMEPIDNPRITIPCGHYNCADCVVNLTNSAVMDDGAAKCPECRGPLKWDKLISLLMFKKVYEAQTKPPVEYFSDTEDTKSDNEGSPPKSKAKGKAPDYEKDSEDTTVDEESESGKIVGDEDNDFLPDLSDIMSIKPTPEAVEKVQVKHHRLGKRKGKASEKAEGSDDDDLEIEYPQPQLEWFSSVKIDKLMEVLKSTRTLNEAESNDVDYLPTKTIVFSYFTSFLDLIEPALKQEGFNYCRYDGSMSIAAREMALADFRNPEWQMELMLISLRAGNVGLNLVEASQVVIMDPFWNPYVEEQAINRTHRIGQMKNVVVHRIIVPDTVEDRILTLQEEKRSMIDSSLDEKSHRAISRLGITELVRLFGIEPRGTGNRQNN